MFQQTARFKAGTNAPAKTGRDNNNKIAVTKIAQTNKGNFNHFYYTNSQNFYYINSIICVNFNLKLLKFPERLNN
jgi:hypothetical protein